MKKFTAIAVGVLAGLAANTYAATSCGVDQATAYVLIAPANAADNQQDPFTYLSNTLIPGVENGSICVNRIVFSFMNPQMNPTTIQQDIASGNLNALATDSGLTVGMPAADSGQVLAQDIAALTSHGVKVLLSVGGWANSSSTVGFPMTQDIMQDFTKAGLDTAQIPAIQPTSTTIAQTSDATNAWVAAAKAFGANGIDLDYEETWFATDTVLAYPLSPTLPTWANPQGAGPFVMPYAVIKYAAYMHALEASAQAQGEIVTVAAPAVASYNIHAGLGGAMYWKPQVGGGNLKGVYYDMAHYQDPTVTSYITQPGQSTPNTVNYAATGVFTNPNGSGDNVLSGLDTIGIMSYDLDDGNDTGSGSGSPVASSWCIGYLNGHLASRDPNTPGYQNVDCSIESQTQAIVQSFSQDLLVGMSNAPKLAFGLEAGFPNYPMNIDASLPGGGDITPQNQNANNPANNARYRWNDPFVAFDIPLVINGTVPQEMTTFAQGKQSDTFNGAPMTDVHSKFLVVNQDLFKTMTQAGANGGFILWSLNNEDYNGHLASGSWDAQQMAADAPYHTAAFAYDFSSYGYTAQVLSDIFQYAASPDQILQVNATNSPSIQLQFSPSPQFYNNDPSTAQYYFGWTYNTGISAMSGGMFNIMLKNAAQTESNWYVGGYPYNSGSGNNAFAETLPLTTPLSANEQACVVALNSSGQNYDEICAPLPVQTSIGLTNVSIAGGTLSWSYNGGPNIANGNFAIVDTTQNKVVYNNGYAYNPAGNSNAFGPLVQFGIKSGDQVCVYPTSNGNLYYSGEANYCATYND